MGSARRVPGGDISQNDYTISVTRRWFSEHVTLEGKPYTLDADQARAVIDHHKNTLVTARAGSGKTRVIVAKVAYLISRRQVSLDEIAVFMFNRAAAAEVNQRLKTVKIDGQSLIKADQPVRVASTFHKYALDIVKMTGEQPQILDGPRHDELIRQSLDQVLASSRQKFTPAEKRNLLNIVSGFIARAGQKFPGDTGLQQLACAVKAYCAKSTDQKLTFYHALSHATYLQYLSQVRPHSIDFNLLMAHATEVLTKSEYLTRFHQVRRLKHIMIDEYQDFSYLFFALTRAIRQLAPQAKLFAVGDDWQAINRFAGSDVNYFLNFAQVFPEDSAHISLATNYRSVRKIVDYANRYMLTHYDPDALPAQAFSNEKGKIKLLNPTKQRFDSTDIHEDALSDGRFQVALAAAAHVPASHISPLAAKLLKQLLKSLSTTAIPKLCCSIVIISRPLSM